MAQFLTSDNLGCLAITSNAVSDNVQSIHLLSAMPSHRGLSITKLGFRLHAAFFCSRKLISSNWDNHDDVYFEPDSIKNLKNTLTI